MVFGKCMTMAGPHFIHKGPFLQVQWRRSIWPLKRNLKQILVQCWWELKHGLAGVKHRVWSLSPVSQWYDSTDCSEAILEIYQCERTGIQARNSCLFSVWDLEVMEAKSVIAGTCKLEQCSYPDEQTYLWCPPIRSAIRACTSAALIHVLQLLSFD